GRTNPKHQRRLSSASAIETEHRPGRGRHPPGACDSGSQSYPGFHRVVGSWNHQVNTALLQVTENSRFSFSKLHAARESKWWWWRLRKRLFRKSSNMPKRFTGFRLVNLEN